MNEVGSVTHVLHRLYRLAKGHVINMATDFAEDQNRPNKATFCIDSIPLATSDVGHYIDCYEHGRMLQ
jgi:hypothetical protein